MSNVINLKDNDRILISRTDRLGDLVLSLPFIETLKIRYPNCRIDVITSLYASPILDNNKRICKILRVQNNLLLTNNLYKKDLLQKIKKENYKIVIVLYPERKISRLFYQAEIPTRIGTAGRFHSIFYNTHIYHSRKKNIKHEYNYNLDFLKFFQPGETIETPSVYIRKKEIIHAQKILKNACIKKEFIVLHPGTGGSSECWPMEHFIKLYKMLEDRGVELVISGSDKEGEDVEILSKKLGIPVKKITGKTDLRTLAAVLSLASLVVANST
ncbi:MAG: glycosyltransferase family 9 protein, partial [Candidatus Zixiibacteriota bacterium]